MSLRIYGNRQLKTLPGLATRPTPARVREALFNIWQGEIEGCRWLDLCTGSGAMGAEALGRGADLVIGIEQSGRACAVIQQNWQLVADLPQSDLPQSDLPQRFQVIRGDVVQQLPRLAGQKFDRIYFDPPYDSDLYAPVLTAIAQFQLLAVEGELAVEHRTDRSPTQGKSSADALLSLSRQKNYGNTALTFYRLASESKYSESKYKDQG